MKEGKLNPPESHGSQSNNGLQDDLAVNIAKYFHAAKQAKTKRRLDLAVREKLEDL